MGHTLRHSISLRAFGAVLLVAATGLAGANDSSTTSLEARLASVEKLIESSSAARMVASSTLSEACAERLRARELLQQAKALAAQGAESSEVTALLVEATHAMMSAVRTVKQHAPEDGSAHKEFDNLATSLDALLDAYIRIRSERGETETKDELEKLVEDRLAKAIALGDRGDWIAGVEVLDEAYVATRVAIDHLRGGETLVRALHFESPADEYAYEVDRNDSLRMLVDLLLAERLADNSRLAESVATRIAKAEAMRRDGERLAGDERFHEAIGTLEGSTIELVRAIRSAGIYIPH